VKNLRPLIIVASVLVVVLISASLGLHAFVHGDSFRSWISKKVSRSLHANGQFESLTWNGSTFQSPKFTAIGSGKSKLASLQLTNVSAHINWWELLKWHWVVDRISAEQVDAVFGKHPAEVPAGSPKKPEQAIKLSNFLPSDLIIANIDLATVNLHWATNHGETGQWLGATVHAVRAGSDQWEIRAAGGKIRHAAYPELQVEEGIATIAQKSIDIHKIHTQVMTGGQLDLKGIIKTDSSLDTNLDCNFSGVDVQQTLPNDWQMTGHGAGELNYTGDLNRFEKGRFTGSLNITDMTMDLSPLFGKMTHFIQLGGLDQVRLDSVLVNFDYQNQKGQFSNLKALYQDQVRIEGSGSFDPQNLNGVIQIGLAPNILSWIPGAGDQVFTEDHDGLRWTTAKISGTPEKPKEDLTKRLLGAVEEKMSKEFKNNAKDAAKTLLDLFRH
jgi:hypothetical protein